MRAPALAAAVVVLVCLGVVMSLGCGARNDATPPATTVPGAPPPPAAATEPPAHTPLGPPQPGDWRHRHPDDTPDDFDDYVDSDPVRADGEVRVIAFQPVGDFDADARRALDRATEFTAIWFDLPTRTLTDLPLTDEEGQWRDRDAEEAARGDRRRRQWRTGWFLHMLLPDLRPKDAVVVLGVTMGDLYPSRSWNYVFGEADLRRRVGVYSLARYFPEFWGEARDEAALRMALLRTLKVVVHETGHMFGLEHCVTWQCAMNGSNSLAETDTQPLRLCPDCLRKLAWNRGFDVAARHDRIATFLEAQGLADEAAWYRKHAPSK